MLDRIFNSEETPYILCLIFMVLVFILATINICKDKKIIKLELEIEEHKHKYLNSDIDSVSWNKYLQEYYNKQKKVINN